jgi:hypothetical protein
MFMKQTEYINRYMILVGLKCEFDVKKQRLIEMDNAKN